jgi:hypothetical protein
MLKGETFEAEWLSFADPETGVEIRQLTNHKGHSHPLYFTNPGWYDGGRRLLFGSVRNLGTAASSSPPALTRRLSTPPQVASARTNGPGRWSRSKEGSTLTASATAGRAGGSTRRSWAMW